MKTGLLISLLAIGTGLAADTLYVRTTGHLWAFAANHNQYSARERTSLDQARFAPNSRVYEDSAATRD
jgi:hypothetical protein